MKQLALAMHGYQNTHGTLPPPALYGRDGTPLLSWRVLLLPYIEQNELYKQFKLDEAWDSLHNLPLLEKMPSLYAPFGGATTPQPYTTYFQVFVGEGAAFEEARQFRTRNDFPDGTGDTLLMVHAGAAIPWTKPVDLVYVPGDPLPKLSGIFPKTFQVATVDGGVRTIVETISEKTLRAAITRNGAEKMGADW